MDRGASGESRDQWVREVSGEESKARYSHYDLNDADEQGESAGVDEWVDVFSEGVVFIWDDGGGVGDDEAFGRVAEARRTHHHRRNGEDT
ncbi:hypothetical protein GCK72_016985 [Caenorhabditis remanei]|uniref:Uncharacterized protein n=1 Tax=Caenorhabditis remanei TaxID=31234 RepID=A0A6A5G6Z2_CAERE|nr:hypothetical protein GCK72_016985 [Caenorhabditis remanei]KAF1750435.1 hypothetical protein GCK72_016985 [Caenorhabditis remanei]